MYTLASIKSLLFPLKGGSTKSKKYKKTKKNAFIRRNADKTSKRKRRRTYKRRTNKHSKYNSRK